jgi:hypothetical protein
MTDNEKRAHDLAILATKCLFEMKIKDNDNHNANSVEKKAFDFDPYDEYIGLYNAYLKRLSDNV